MAKMTFQPKKRQRSKVHGFRSRMSTPGGRKVLAARRAKGRKVLSAQAAFCGLFFILQEKNTKYEIFRVFKKEQGFSNCLSSGKIPGKQIFNYVCVTECWNQESPGNICKQKSRKQRSKTSSHQTGKGKLPSERRTIQKRLRSGSDRKTFREGKRLS